MVGTSPRCYCTAVMTSGICSRLNVIEIVMFPAILLIHQNCSLPAPVVNCQPACKFRATVRHDSKKAQRLHLYYHYIVTLVDIVIHDIRKRNHILTA